MAKHLKTFLDEDYAAYAVYRAYQRIPHILDSMGQTQRKIIHVLSDFPETKKHKTLDIFSYVYTKTKYLHGDMSVYNVVENLARECSNNLNLLTAEGSFGYRTNKTAAAPRYTGTRFSKVGRLIFPKDDRAIYHSQEFEGQEIEPQFLLPILPVSLINGYSAIAVGFASKFLPREPIEVIDKMIEALTYKKRANANWDNYSISEIKPAFPFYSGMVFRDTEHEDAAAWVMTGALHKTKNRNIVEITDLPPEINRESYIKKLKKLQEKGVIRDFTEACVKNTFKFKVKVALEHWKKSEDELISLLGLIDRAVENFVFMDFADNTDDVIKKFNTAEEYLKAFIEERQGYYQIRKDYMLDKLKEEILTLKERIRFIQEVNNGDIIITKRKKTDLEKELDSRGYAKIDGNFDHLLGMRMYALTEENIKKFMDFIKAKEKEFADLEKTKIEDLHIRELKELRKEIIPELQKKGLQT